MIKAMDLFVQQFSKEINLYDNPHQLPDSYRE